MLVVLKTKDDVLEFIKMARIATLNLLFIYVWCEQIVGAHVVISFTQAAVHLNLIITLIFGVRKK